MKWKQVSLCVCLGRVGGFFLHSHLHTSSLGEQVSLWVDMRGLLLWLPLLRVACAAMWAWAATVGGGPRKADPCSPGPAGGRSKMKVSAVLVPAVIPVLGLHTAVLPGPHRAVCLSVCICPPLLL